MEIYVVNAGDTVDDIALKYGVNVENIIFDNQLVYPYELAVGQSLLIQVGQSNPDRYIKSNGYAYPFISNWVLENTLPYLSELSIFSYGFTENGELIPPLLDDMWMIETAYRYETLPILTLTPFGPDGNFNNNLISAIVGNPVSRDNLIDNLLITMENKGYRGLDMVIC